MSSTLIVYAVSFERLGRLRGCRDRGLLAAIREEFGDFLEQIDQLRADDEEAPTCLEAIAQIIEGDALDDGYGSVYGYALEALCAHLGRELPEVAGISRASAWTDEIDEVLKGEGVPIRLSDLIFGFCPVDLPSPDDHPYIGAWPPQAIAPALDVVRRVDVAGMGFDHAEAIRQIRDWLEAAASRPGDGLVGVLS